MLPLLDIFTSAEHFIDGHICIVEEGEVGVAIEEELVYKRLNGQELTNWTTTEIPKVIMIEK